MAVLVSRNNAIFQPGVDALPFVVDPGLTIISVALDHGDWPEGQCFRLDVSWDDGSTTGTVECGGGLVRDKAGVPTGGTTTTTWTCRKSSGVAGGTVRLEVLQRLRTAVLIEGF